MADGSGQDDARYSAMARSMLQILQTQNPNATVGPQCRSRTPSQDSLIEGLGQTQTRPKSLILQAVYDGLRPDLVWYSEDSIQHTSRNPPNAPHHVDSAKDSATLLSTPSVLNNKESPQLPESAMSPRTPSTSLLSPRAFGSRQNDRASAVVGVGEAGHRKEGRKFSQICVTVGEPDNNVLEEQLQVALDFRGAQQLWRELGQYDLLPKTQSVQMTGDADDVWESSPMLAALHAHQLQLEQTIKDLTHAKDEQLISFLHKQETLMNGAGKRIMVLEGQLMKVFEANGQLKAKLKQREEALNELAIKLKAKMLEVDSLTDKKDSGAEKAHHTKVEAYYEKKCRQLQALLNAQKATASGTIPPSAAQSLQPHIIELQGALLEVRKEHQQLNKEANDQFDTMLEVMRGLGAYIIQHLNSNALSRSDVQHYLPLSLNIDPPTPSETFPKPHRNPRSVHKTTQTEKVEYISAPVQTDMRQPNGDANQLQIGQPIPERSSRQQPSKLWHSSQTISEQPSKKWPSKASQPVSEHPSRQQPPKPSHSNQRITESPNRQQASKPSQTSQPGPSAALLQVRQEVKYPRKPILQSKANAKGQKVTQKRQTQHFDAEPVFPDSQSVPSHRPPTGDSVPSEMSDNKPNATQVPPISPNDVPEDDAFPAVDEVDLFPRCPEPLHRFPLDLEQGIREECVSSCPGPNDTDPNAQTCSSPNGPTQKDSIPLAPRNLTEGSNPQTACEEWMPSLVEVSGRLYHSISCLLADLALPGLEAPLPLVQQPSLASVPKHIQTLNMLASALADCVAHVTMALMERPFESPSVPVDVIEEDNQRLQKELVSLGQQLELLRVNSKGQKVDSFIHSGSGKLSKVEAASKGEKPADACYSRKNSTWAPQMPVPTFAAAMQMVSDFVGQTGPPEVKVLLTEAKQIAKESAANTMRRVVSTVRARKKTWMSPEVLTNMFHDWGQRRLLMMSRRRNVLGSAYRALTKSLEDLSHPAQGKLQATGMKVMKSGGIADSHLPFTCPAWAYPKSHTPVDIHFTPTCTTLSPPSRPTTTHQILTSRLPVSRQIPLNLGIPTLQQEFTLPPLGTTSLSDTARRGTYAASRTPHPSEYSRNVDVQSSASGMLKVSSARSPATVPYHVPQRSSTSRTTLAPPFQDSPNMHRVSLSFNRPADFTVKRAMSTPPSLEPPTCLPTMQATQSNQPTTPYVVLMKNSP